MSSIAENIALIKKDLPDHVTLIAVSKTRTNEEIMEAYHAGQRDFGENKVQELVPKYEALPKDIRWHLIGHLQSNKVKYIAPFVHLVHSVDSEKLLAEIDKQAAKCGRKISVLLQVFIASEETKFGFSFDEATALLQAEPEKKYQNIEIKGLMGMATNTDNEEQIRTEFQSLYNFNASISHLTSHVSCLSFGMSSDWKIAIEEGSTMIRVGSSIFGERNYSNQ